MIRHRRLAGDLGAALLLIIGVVIAAWRVSPWVHDRVVETIAARFDSEVTLESFEVSFLPRPAFVGRDRGGDVPATTSPYAACGTTMKPVRFSSPRSQRSVRGPRRVRA